MARSVLGELNRLQYVVDTKKVGNTLPFNWLMFRPHMADLIRAVIAESPRFPELRGRTFNFGTLPVPTALNRYFRAGNNAGTASVSDPGLAAAQFPGMVASALFWPRLLHGQEVPTAEQTHQVVNQAALTIAARYGASAQH
ncbi:TetR/AcrR family transcriptional regulator C-terminal domain-containing protein [Arthrobacter sp. ATA002]|uniref:TetR/AcrR family transcriptional regulator C-terminal domain-containing protein n=1 Tax=Arthrobacter sp. ATA002 TaxID=2991715 RepID=UPI0022A7AA2E|nr:TetR/AcrR family transcriptional regulator C-terminal domain-containing protein [Arthrobacter sp. ATA002]WAP51776.1 TetR/AcrR family transcriptional regulator C-terminal domain-containing protein [Arthrobacter sp. ATA002]